MNAFQHHHFNAEYEPIITFVDSPPNSEESWTGIYYFKMQLFGKHKDS